MKKDSESLSHNCGYKLSDLRKTHKLTQAELAEKLNISKSTLGHYEQGLSVPPPQLLLSFSNFFQIPVDYLLGKCACTKEYSHLSDKFCDNTTFGDIVNRLDELSLKDRQHILYLLKIMKRANEK